MTAVLVSVAEAVKNALNAGVTAGAFSQTFTAVRSYADWNDTLEDLENTLHVDVVPVQRGHSLAAAATRASRKYQVAIDIAVRKKFGTADQNGTTGRIDQTKIDALVLLLEQIDQFFVFDRLSGYIAAAWVDTADSGIRLTYSREDVKQARQFTGIVRVVFDVRVTIT